VTETSGAATDVHPPSGRHARPDAPSPARDVATWAFLAVVAIDVVAGLYYRFTTTSKMWLDEAQSVNIASKPIRDLPAALRRDGAPPLYYALLHFWMGVAGHSDASIRALSGVFAVLALPLMWWVVRRGFGRMEAWAALGFLAASPFAVYYATETRMYSLVMLLATAGVGSVIALFAKPTVPRMLLLALIASLLVYTHYWAFYLFVPVGVWLVWVALRATGDRRRSGAYGLVSLALAVVAFLPWLPSFLYQRAHTGTPWASAPTLASAYGWLAGFIFNQNIHSNDLSLHLEIALLCLIFLLVFGIAAAPLARDRMEFRLTGQPRARVLAFVAVGTLAVGWLASRAASTAFQPRYSSVVYPVIVVLVALGIVALPTRWLQVGVFVVASFAALWTVHWGAQAQRTQAGKVAKVMHASVADKSLVVVCPDQLGPSLLRYANATRYRFVGYPRFSSPDLVNWVDYKRVVDATSLEAFATRVTRAAGAAPFYLVWSQGYGFHEVCSNLRDELTRVSGRTPSTLVIAKKYVFYQSMNLLEYPPTR